LTCADAFRGIPCVPSGTVDFFEIN